MQALIFQLFFYAILHSHMCSDSARRESPSQLMFYEYGVRVKGDQMSYLHKGNIPSFTPIYTVNVTPTEIGFEKRFTYLRVEYMNLLSKVNIKFDPKTMIVTFLIKYPFVYTPMAIVGYSLPFVNVPV